MWSDGDDYLEMVGLWYKDHGYDFLCFTDHNRLAKSERWVKVNQNRSPPAAVQKLKARFPKDWVEESRGRRSDRRFGSRPSRRSATASPNRDDSC